MRYGNRIILLCVAIMIAGFVWFLRPIMANTVRFETDEMYWISTSDSLFRILKGDFGSRLWREHFGFANLNGAKLLYGTGLLIGGYTDVKDLGVGAETYYRWEKLAGKPFPESHARYPLLRFARLYSSLFVSAGVLLVFLCTLLLTQSLVAGLVASAFMAYHPVTIHVASHALADSMFLFFHMLLLFMLLLGHKKKPTPLLDIGTGIAFAWLVSVKMNGFLFLPVIFLLALPPHGLPDWTTANDYAYRIVRICTVALVAFFLLHPNFFFYPSYSPIDIYRDRVRITMNHIGFFGSIDPAHVTLSYDTRLASLMRHVFPLWMAVASCVSLCIISFRVIRNNVRRMPIVWLTSIVMTGIVIIAYTTFDEQRYYYPLVPILCVMVGLGFRMIRPMSSRSG